MTVSRSSNSFFTVNVGDEGINYTNVKVPATIDNDLTDGDFASWQSDNVPDAWVSEGLTGGGDADYTLITQSEDSQGGSYAVSMESDGSGNSNLLFNELNTYGANGETMQVRLYGKTADSATVGAVYVYEHSGTNDIYYWNFTGGAAGTWTVDAGSGPTSDQIESWSPTSSYTQNTFTQVTLPGSNVLEGWAYITAGGVSKTALVDGCEILIAGADEASNGTFEAWTAWANQDTPLDSWTFEPGTDWSFTPSVGDSEVSAIIKSTDVQAGSNSVQLMVGDMSDLTANDDRGYIYQQIAGVATTAITASVYTKTTNSKVPFMVLLNDNPGVHTEIWDFVAGTWDVLATTVTDLPGTSNAMACSATTSYVENTADLVIPTSGKVTMVLMTDKGDGATQQSYFFDTASLGEETAGTQIQQFSTKCGSAIADFEENDRILEWADGATNIFLAQTLSDEGEAELDVMWDSDLPGRHNFTGMDMFFGTPVNAYNPADKNYVDGQVVGCVHLLGSVSVDYKTVGQTTIYTVPLGYLLRGFYTETKTVTSVAPNNDSVAQMGTAVGSYNDVTGTVIQPSSSVGDVEKSLISSTLDIASGEVVKVDVTTADTGTDLDAIVYLYGILIPV